MFKSNRDHFLLIVLAAIFLTVFIQSDTLMNGLESSKRLYFYLASSLLIITVCVQLIIRNKRVTANLNLIDLAIALMLLYQFIKVVFTPHAGIISNQFITQLLLISFYFIIKFTAVKETNYSILIFIFLGIGLLESVIALLQLYGILPSNSLYFKLTGSFGNPDAFAGFTAPVLVYSFGLYKFSEEKNLLKHTALVTAIILVLSMAATQIRGGWIAVISGSSIIYLYGNKEILIRIFSSRLRLYLSIVLILIASTAIIVLLYNMKPDSANGRLLIWKISTGILSESPVYGIGYDRFAVEYNNAQAEYFSEKPGNEYEIKIAGNVNRAHNEYLEWTVEYGAIGLILFAFLVLSIFIPKSHNDAATSRNISAKAALLAILIFSLTSFPLHILPSQINFYFLLGIISSRQDSRMYTFGSGKRLKLVVSIIILLAVLLIGFTFKQYYHYTQWNKAMALAYNGHYLSAEKIFSELEPGLHNEGEFLFNYGGMLSLAGKHERAIKILNDAKEKYTNPNLYISLGNSYSATGNYNEAEKYYIHAINMIPHKLYQKYLLANLYIRMGKISNALSLAREIISAKEKVNSQAASEIKAEMLSLISKFEKL